MPCVWTMRLGIQLQGDAIPTDRHGLVRPRWKRYPQACACEAVRAVMRHAFGNLRAASLFAGHHPRNTALRNLSTEPGFAYTHHEFYADTGCHHPPCRLPAS